MPQLGPLEILVVAIVALMVFGPKRLPEVGRQVGHGIRELRKIQETVRAEIHDVLNAPEIQSSPSRADSVSDDAVSDAPGALPAGYRTSGTPNPVGRPAPSRFRPPVTAHAPVPPDAGGSDTGGPDAGDSDAGQSSGGHVDTGPAEGPPANRVVPAPGNGTRAPSRFRAPGA